MNKPESVAAGVVTDSLEIEVGRVRYVAQQGGKDLGSVGGAGQRHVQRLVQTARTQNGRVNDVCVWARRRDEGVVPQPQSFES